MLRRSCLIPSLAALAVLAGAAASPAATIDPELQRILDEHGKSDYIPVLMVFPQDLTGDLGDLEVQLDGGPPKKKRDGVIAALKKAARKAQEDAWDVLDDPDHPGLVVYAEMLYLSNAIAFGADREMILAVAAAKNADDAILFFDREYDLLSGLGPVVDGEKGPIGTGGLPWSLARIHADRVWDELGFTGEGVVVGHIDTGAWLTHPDLRARLWRNPGELPGNGVDDDANGFVDDVFGWDFGDRDADPNDDAVNSGHGTHTAGSVVGDGAGGTRTGVAPGARLQVCKVFNHRGQGTLGAIWAAQQYCLENGAHVITMSLSVRGDLPDVFLRAERYNAIALRAAGVTVINSAGNDHLVFDPPLELGMTARVPAPWVAGQPYGAGGIVTVGGTDAQDAVFSGSSQGPAAWGEVAPWHDWPYGPGDGLVKPDVAAPAVGICSTLPPNRYSGETWVGTSMACPQVAGVVALMLQKNPSLSPEAVARLLQETAVDLGAPGKDNVFGAGLVDAFAAVAAVDPTLMPNLEHTACVLDPEGDGVLDPAEIAGVSFTLANVGLVDATALTAYLEIPGNPHVSVAGDGVVAWPDIPAGGAASNVDLLRVAVSPAAPQGYVCSLLLTVISDGGFQRTFEIPAVVGLPEHRTHDAGRVYLTITDQGSLGYLDDTRVHGDGMGVDGAASSLFIASLWGGTGWSYVCNNDLTADGADPREWVPGDRVSVVEAGDGAQTFAASFGDGGHPQPRGVSVEQVSWAWAEPPRDDLVVLQYRIRNAGPADLAGYRVGLFVDWDVADLMTNVGGSDPLRRTVWVNEPGGRHFGVVVLGHQPVSNLSLVDNPHYVYPQNHVADAHKWQFLAGEASLPASDAPNDWASVAAAGPFDLPAGGTVTVAFALVCGEDRDDYLAGVAAAMNGTVPTVGVDDVVSPSAPRLAPNQPNPFNPSTEIRFTLPTAQVVDLAVHDLAGRRVRTLAAGPLPAGAHAARWDGTDDSGAALPSGLYVCRMTAATGTVSRKMMLVR